MSDLQDNPEKRRAEHKSSDPWSERLVVVVVVWIALVVLLPLHALVIYNFVTTGWSFGFLVLAVIYALPLIVIDVFAVRWFSDNFSVMRWINRSGSRNGGESARR